MEVTVTRFSELTKTQWAACRRLKCGPSHESYIESFIEESEKYMLDRYCVICEDGDKIIGWVIFENFARLMETSAEEVERIHIFVMRKYRGKGAGTKLLDATVEFAKEKGFALSGFHNKYSEKLYKRFNVKNIF